MVSMAAAAKIAVLLAVAALFATAGADDPQAKKEAGCWQCYSTCMDKCDNSSDGGKDYFTCKKKCIVDCYKDLPPVCYKMCIAETCLKLPPYKQGDCFKACGHKCFHNHPGPKPGPPKPKPKPKPTPPKPKPPTPPKPTPTPTPTPPKPTPTPTPSPPKPTPPRNPPCPKRCPPKPKPPPKQEPPCPPAAKKAPEAEGSHGHVSLPCARPGGCRPEQATNDTRNGNTNN
ncbi:leucine-rich repeat extensin-like protein 3 [Lolium rigidum]|uniref:leucine-rich repeat extensin-like protein 3 n=1 Tax=Lolium rigidum TaxID=89674 RepID=UPI001F5C73A2|nr:leucine-rich repeat extensin-like protein 3 [Lolium rigidum]